MARTMTRGPGASIGVTNASQVIKLHPGAGDRLWIANLGTRAIHAAAVTSSAGAATTANLAIPPGRRVALVIAPAIHTHLALISPDAGPHVAQITREGGPPFAEAPYPSSYAGVIAGRTWTPNSISDGVSTSGTSRYRAPLRASQAALGLQLVFVNWYVTPGATAETAGANAITVRASVEIGGIKVPVYFGDAAQVTIAPGGQAIGVVLPGTLLAGPGFLGVNTFVQVASAGQTWPQSNSPTTLSALGEGVNYAAPGADLTGEGSAAVGASSSAAYGPIAILGLQARAGGFLCGLGDSLIRLSGSGETTGDANGNTGWLARLLAGAGVGYLNLAQSGARASYMVAPGGADRRLALMAQLRPSDVVLALGTNDFTNGQTDAQIRANMLDLARRVVAIGARPWLSTVAPVSTSTDAWATVLNQTTHASNAVRVANNAWRRAIPAPFVGCLEVADLVESARDSGLWRAAYTDDGTHTNQTAAAAIAAGLIIPPLIAA